jgi:hypothetical protein
MAITTINVGNTPNDGSGDSIRVAFQKANANFTELQTRIGNLATSGGTTGLTVNGPVEITAPTASPGLFTGTFRIRATALDPYFDIATVAQGFSGGPVAGITTFTNPQNSTSTTTGAVVISGGLGVAGRATLDNAVINGNIAVVNLNLTAGGQITLPDGSPFSYDVIANAATQADQIALKAPLASPALTGTPTAPTAAAGTNTTQVATTGFVYEANTGILSRAVYLDDIILANLGAYQSWANLTLSTVANAVNQQEAIESLTSNASVQSIAINDINANVGTIYLGNIATQSNLGAYQTYANTQSATFDANLGTLFLGNVSTQSNLGAYQTYANTQSATFDANLGTIYLGNISTQANLGAYQTYANTQSATFDANLGTLYLGNIATQSNLGAYQIWANAQFAPLVAPIFTGNIFTNTAANLFVSNNATATFTSNVEIGSEDGTAANLTVRNGSVANFGDLVNFFSTITATSNVNIANGGNVFVQSRSTFTSNIDIASTGNIFSFANLTQASSNVYITDTANLVSRGNIVTNSNVSLETGSNLMVAGDITNGWANVNVWAGANVFVKEGAEFSIFGGNVTVYKNTAPGTSVGSAGDFPGMIFTDGTNLYVCNAPYDGTSSIWYRTAVATFP